MLDIINSDNKITAIYKGQKIITVSENLPFNQQVRAIFYALGQINPSISRDLVEYELDLMLKAEL